ncbi:F0F1 ATP synthase subunit alpha, partial [Alishewanella sp. SMS9]|nr:F0F1 ATP synthase subunit alpha [Alishewanella sp. SMS9]
QLEHGQKVTELMKQLQYSPMSVAEMGVSIFAIEKGFMKDVDVAKILDFEAGLIAFMKAEHAELMAEIDKTGNYNDQIESTFKAAIDKFKATQTW